MKKSVKNEYFKCVRLALKLKLNTGNIFQALSIWAVPTVRYGAEIIQWTKEELQKMDRKTRKRITIYGRLHSSSCIDRIYIPRSDGGRGLVSVENCIEEEKYNLSNYATQIMEGLVKTAEAEPNFEIYIVNVSKKKKSTTWTVCEENRMPQ